MPEVNGLTLPMLPCLPSENNNLGMRLGGDPVNDKLRFDVRTFTNLCVCVCVCVGGGGGGGGGGGKGKSAPFLCTRNTLPGVPLCVWFGGGGGGGNPIES